MKDRIKEIQSSKNMSQRDFANAIGIAPGALSNIYNSRTNPTANHVNAIHNAFPEINVAWLMFGEGEMYNQQDRSSSPLSICEGSPTNGSFNQDVDSGFAGTLFDQPQLSSVSTEESQADGLLPFQTQRISAGQPSQPSEAHRAQQAQLALQRQAALLAAKNEAKNIDTKARKVKEIRVFFDDGTYETFVPGQCSSK